MSTLYELTPKVNRQKSYYGKAIVHIEGGIRTLFSYETPVASFDPATCVLSLKGWFSMTTGRHLEDFCAQCAEDIGANWFSIRSAIQQAARLHSGRAFYEEVESVDMTNAACVVCNRRS